MGTGVCWGSNRLVVQWTSDPLTAIYDNLAQPLGKGDSVTIHYFTLEEAVIWNFAGRREVADSRTWGIFIQDTAYFIVILWNIRSYSIESRWNNHALSLIKLPHVRSDWHCGICVKVYYTYWERKRYRSSQAVVRWLMFDQRSRWKWQITVLTVQCLRCLLSRVPMNIIRNIKCAPCMIFSKRVTPSAIHTFPLLVIWADVLKYYHPFLLT